MITSAINLTSSAKAADLKGIHRNKVRIKMMKSTGLTTDPCTKVDTAGTDSKWKVL